MKESMKAHVYVTLKKTVLDAQGKTVCQALRGMGHSSIADVRQGKYFEIDIADGADPVAVRAEIDLIAREILANPVIEDYRLDIEE
jgi:phosphoribosylformylglycinamidine synthase PurS subunit